MAACRLDIVMGNLVEVAGMEDKCISIEELLEQYARLTVKQILRLGLPPEDSLSFYHFKGYRWWKVPLFVVESLYNGGGDLITPIYIEQDEEFAEMTMLPSPEMPPVIEKVKWTTVVLVGCSPDGKETRHKEINWTLDLLHIRGEYAAILVESFSINRPNEEALPYGKTSIPEQPANNTEGTGGFKLQMHQ